MKTLHPREIQWCEFIAASERFEIDSNLVLTRRELPLHVESFPVPGNWPTVSYREQYLCDPVRHREVAAQLTIRRPVPL
jgi:hypothetical protein